MSCQVCWGEWAGCCGVKGGGELVFVGNQKNNKSGKYCDTLCPEEYRKGRCVCVCLCVFVCGDHFVEATSIHLPHHKHIGQEDTECIMVLL